MNPNPSPTPEAHADELASTRRWAPLAIPLAAAMILGTTFLIWMQVLLRA
ncbi:hypothetical protein [Piscinibacter sp. XHJ-5]|nr:hypothetical protein [Piscinibacter sp. XHJ-5]